MRDPNDFVKLASAKSMFSIALRRKIVLAREVMAKLALSLEGHFEKSGCCARVFYRQGRNI
uniref:Uncharacterized protein n=1 Tax=Romanomermis culicivorax TaxID=13658 RepID=A0A915IPC0_ROMCU